MDRSLTALGHLKHWSGVVINGAVLFLAIVLLRFAVAAFATIRAAWNLPSLLRRILKQGVPNESKNL